MRMYMHKHRTTSVPAHLSCCHLLCLQVLRCAVCQRDKSRLQMNAVFRVCMSNGLVALTAVMRAQLLLCFL